VLCTVNDWITCNDRSGHESDATPKPLYTGHLRELGLM
jgi:hypothetical protein